MDYQKKTMKKQKQYVACYSEEGDYVESIAPKYLGVYNTRKEARDRLVEIMKIDRKGYPFDFKGNYGKLRYEIKGFGYKWAGSVLEINR